MKTIRVNLPDQLDAKLLRAAQKSRTTKSKLVRRAVQAYLKPNGASEPGSFLEVAGDLVGSLCGPGDLSFNPIHLQEYGR